MSRLIDADALRQAMYHEAFETDSEMQKWDSGCWIRYKMFENAIEDAPTISPKTGRWIEPEMEGCWSYDKKAYAQCSVCGGKEFLGWKKAFCPNCGADMRGEI